jgi:predicted Rdx family selenoprotein
MTLITYKGNFDYTVRIDVTLTTEISGADGKTPVNKAHIGQFEVDDIKLVPLTTDTFPMLEHIMTLPNNPGMGAKETIWVPRGDKEDVARCFLAVKGGTPLGYFNIGTSVIKVTHAGEEFTPNECGGFNGGLDSEDFAKVIYASTCYYDIVTRLNPTTFGPYVICTTNDLAMKDDLLRAGWLQPEKGNSFFDALTSIAPERDDGRGPRFTVEDGQFMERCKSGYEPKDLLVHTIGSCMETLTLVE